MLSTECLGIPRNNSGIEDGVTFRENKSRFDLEVEGRFSLYSRQRRLTVSETPKESLVLVSRDKGTTVVEVLIIFSPFPLVL